MENELDEEKLKKLYSSIPTTNLNSTKIFYDSIVTGTRTVLPYEHNCLSIKNKGRKTPIYLNGSICFDEYGRKYILAEIPLNPIIPSFWAAIIQEGVNSIIMLTDIKNLKGIESNRYWPALETCKIKSDSQFITEWETKGFGTIDDYSIRFDTITMKCSCIGGASKVILVHRVFSIDHKSFLIPRRLDHFQFLLWPTHKEPKIGNIMSLYQTIEKNLPPNPILLFNCNTGSGESATFRILYYYIGLIKKQDEMNYIIEINLIRDIYILRQQREHAVQTFEQFLFLHKALCHFAQTFEKKIIFV